MAVVRQLGKVLRGCGSIEFGGVGSLLLTACALAQRTGGSRRRHGAAVPVGTKKMFERLVQTCGTGQMLYVPGNGTNEIK